MSRIQIKLIFCRQKNWNLNSNKGKVNADYKHYVHAFANNVITGHELREKVAKFGHYYFMVVTFCSYTVDLKNNLAMIKKSDVDSTHSSFGKLKSSFVSIDSQQLKHSPLIWSKSNNISNKITTELGSLVQFL